MALRNDRLKKLEAELHDSEEWLKLGLVPKKDIDKHVAEIEVLKAKVEEEQDKLRFLKESGDLEEYVTPRKQPTRTQYTEMPTLPEVDLTEEGAGDTTETTETEANDGGFETTIGEENTKEEETEELTDHDDPFSDRNRWKRGMLHDENEEW